MADITQIDNNDGGLEIRGKLNEIIDKSNLNKTGEVESGNTETVNGGKIYDSFLMNSENDIKAALMGGRVNVFASTATSPNISKFEQCIIDFKVLEGLSNTERYYIDEFRVRDAANGYQFKIRDSNDIQVYFFNKIYTAPTTNPDQLADVLEYTDGGVTVRLTINWLNFIDIIFNTTELESHELNNDFIFSPKIRDVDNNVSLNTAIIDAQILKQDTENTETNAKIGIENKSINILTNPELIGTTGWQGNTDRIDDGFIYYEVPDVSIFQNNDLNYDLGTKFILACKMKSIASIDFFFSGKLTYTDDSFDFIRVFSDSVNCFLLPDGYYQLVLLIDATKDVKKVGFEMKPSLIGGATPYAEGEGVFAKEPYVSTYEEGEEFYFTDNNYFPVDRINDYARVSLVSKDLEQDVKDEIEASTISELIKFDPSIIINMLGDSYTQLGYDDDRGFIFFGSNYLGLDKAVNFKDYGEGGTRVANNSLTITDVDAMVNRYDQMNDSDALGIMGGFNDGNAPFTTWVEKLGSIATKTDTNTIWGAYATIIEGHKTLYTYTNSSIFLMTYPYDQDDNDKIDLMQTIRDIASHYSLPLLDFHKLCGFIKDLNCDLSRTPLNDGLTWIDAMRIDINDGFIIQSGATGNAENWSYIADYIPVDVLEYRTLAMPVNANILQYHWTGVVYEYLGYKFTGGPREGILQPTCTHIRVQSFTNNKGGFTIEDGEFVTDGVHPNLIGFRDKMSPVFAEFLERILKRR